MAKGDRGGKRAKGTFTSTSTSSGPAEISLSNGIDANGDIKYKTYTLYDRIPDGWEEDTGATTAPEGYIWIRSRGSLLTRKSGLIKNPIYTEKERQAAESRNIAKLQDLHSDRKAREADLAGLRKQMEQSEAYKRRKERERIDLQEMRAQNSRRGSAR